MPAACAPRPPATLLSAPGPAFPPKGRAPCALDVKRSMYVCIGVWIDVKRSMYVYIGVWIDVKRSMYVCIGVWIDVKRRRLSVFGSEIDFRSTDNQENGHKRQWYSEAMVQWCTAAMVKQTRLGWRTGGKPPHH
jgi:hypothetical protein